ncbi:hypothetical protein BGZ75_010038 [Mortierella antarctica]|nr:hypothetical protein BGZ75_010038 [Mortierella antarctica]
MTFPENSVALKLGFALDFIIFILGMVTLISLAKNVTDVALIIVAALAQFSMDCLTWKSSESYKRRDMSVAAIVLAIAMSLLSFSATAVVDLGMKETCKYFPGCYKVYDTPASEEVLAGVVCSSLAGACFLIYAISEYTQYRRRQA